MADFPLADWFDLTKPISRDDREMFEAQMALYALKDGDDPCGEEVRKACAELRAAVKAHNVPFHAAREQQERAEAALRAKVKAHLIALGETRPKRRSVNRVLQQMRGAGGGGA